MAGSFHSDNWYRVESLRPELRPHVRIHRHRYRGSAWYVLQDMATGRTLRITPDSARLIELIDGQRTIGAAWQLLVADAGRTPPRQDELIDVLSQAHSMDLLQVDLPPEISRLASRKAKQDAARLRGQVFNPLSIKLPLIDPDRFLSGSLWLVRPLLGPLGLVAWLLLVGWTGVQALMHWADLTNNWHDRLFSLGNLAAIWLIYPVVKALHELGHGYAVKSLGGEVHEMGVMFIYLTPVPYVDASAANAFASKWQRALVSGAGIMVELLLAAVAMGVWLAVEPGLLRSLAFNVMVICGVSTVIFNGNPLMRYDGYFLLADVIEMPNLASRSASFWTRLLQKKLYGIAAVNAPIHTLRERAWLFGYQLAAVAYRTILSLSIALWLAAEYFFIGVTLALAICWTTLVKPLVQGLRFLVSDLRLYGRRKRAAALTLVVAAAVVAGLVFIPLPARTTAEGVVWIAEDSQIRAAESGFISRVLASPGATVEAGQPVFVATDRELVAGVEKAEARVRELEVSYSMKAYTDRVAAAVARDAIVTEGAELDRLHERQAQLVARSNVAGTLSIARAEDLEGRYVRKGELLGYVLNDAPRVVRVVVEQDTIDQLRSHLVGAQMRVAGRVGDIRATRVIREVPAGIHDLPSPALSIAGGGTIPYDPQSPRGEKAIDRIFQFDFALDDALAAVPIGTRVYVRLNFERESLFQSAYRRIRQLLLARLDL